MRSIALFAHNEEESIAKTIASLNAAGLAAQDHVFVLANGCSDDTLSIVENIANKDSRIVAVDIALGDKANAWNLYVDRIGLPDARIHIFLDGDVIPSKNAFIAMDRALKDHPEALAVSTLPRGGRKAEPWAQRTIKNHGMPGGLYGLRGETFERIRTLPLRLPIGLVGDDSILCFCLLRDLDPQASSKLEYIRPVLDAFFDYKSFPLHNLSGIRSLWRRQLRYARRDLEDAVLVQRITEGGLAAMPRRADELWDSFVSGVFRQHRLRLRCALYPITLLQARRQRGRPLKAQAWDNQK